MELHPLVHHWSLFIRSGPGHRYTRQTDAQWSPSCRQPGASSRSLGPIDRLCCPTPSPPRTPEAPAAAPSPSQPTRLEVKREGRVTSRFIYSADEYTETLRGLTVGRGGAVLLIQHQLLHLFPQVLLVDARRVEGVAHKLGHSRTRRHLLLFFLRWLRVTQTGQRKGTHCATLS